MTHIIAKNIGPIANADIKLGDITILVGPQASGKSVFLQLLKLVRDYGAIQADIERYGYDKRAKGLLSVFFGEGMGNIWNEATRVEVDGKTVARETIGGGQGHDVERVFYIPAQRIVSMTDGRPKNFMEFDPANPYVLRHFSETIRLLIQNGLGENDVVFPFKSRLRSEVSAMFDQNVFHGARIVLEQRDGLKKMRMHIGASNIPFMTWSAGQKEFLPLLLGLYCVSGTPNRIVNKDGVDCVIIEEPEMGLHPRAVLSVLYEILTLVEAGKKVVLSTHSSVPVEFAWAYNFIKTRPQQERASLLGSLFQLPESVSFSQRQTSLDIRTYYMSRQEDGVVSQDISSLDIASDNADLSEWGGMMSFSTTVNNVVSSVVNN